MIAAFGYAQQIAQYNQYIFNELIINPSYAGTKGIININAIYSKQWIGITGSPTTQTLSIEGPASEKIGLGLNVINDHIGAQSQQGLFGSYSYKLRINDKYKLSMGLAFGVTNFTLDGTKLTTATQDDPAVPKTSVSKIKFNAKTGLFLYSKKFYAGFSISDLLANAFAKEGYMIKLARHYFLTSGYTFDIGHKLKFKPSFLLKGVSKSPVNFDINSFFIYNEKIWLGASVRLGSSIIGPKTSDNSLKQRDAFIFITEYNINEKFRIGYAYITTTSVLKNHSGNEISMGYYFPYKTTIKKMATIKYF